MARLMASGGNSALPTPGLGATRSSGGVQLGRTASNFASKNPSLRDAIDSIAGGGDAPKKDVFSLALKPVSLLLDGLNLAAIPGRAVVAGIDEIQAATDWDKTKGASWDRFAKNAMDRDYGFKQMADINTGQDWLDSTIGFVGDAVLDPTSYMTFGASKFAGYTGRLDLAKTVLNLTDDAALANKVQKYGRAAIKDADLLERAGANRHGLYLLGHRTGFGKMQQGIRIPGTGVIGYASDNALTRVRTGLMGTRGGKFIQKITLDSDGLAARQALLQGNVSDDAAGALISYFTSDPVARRAAGQALTEESAKALDTLTRERAKGLDGYMKQIPDLIEDEAAFNAASPEMQRAAQVWIDLFGGYENNIIELLKKVDPTIDPKTRFRERYFPRIMSDAGLNYMDDATNPHSSNLRQIYSRDPMGGGRNFKSRTLEKDDIFFGHKLTLEDLKSTTKLNEIARKAGFDGDFFETDMGKVVDRYVKEYAKEVGVLTRHQHLVDTGFWKYADSVEITGEHVDDVLVQSVKKKIKSLDEDLASLSRQNAEHMRAIGKNLEELRKTLANNLGEAEKTLDDFEQYGDLSDALTGVLQGNTQLSLDQLELVADSLGSLKKTFAELAGGTYKGGKLIANVGEGLDDGPMIADGFLGYMDNLDNDLRELHAQIADLTVDAQGKVLAADVDVAMENLQKMNTRLSVANERMRMVFKFGNAVEEGIAKMAKGEVYNGGSIEVHHVLALMARDGSVTTDVVKEIIDNQFNIAGALQDFISNWTGQENGIFGALTLNAGLKVSDISTYTPSDLYELMYKMHNARVNPDDIRLGALFALASDERIYNGKIPEAVQQMRSRLIGQLKRMDEAIGFSRLKGEEIARGTKSNSSQIFETQVKAKYDEVISNQEKLVGLTRFLDEVVPKLRSTPGAMDTPFDVEDLRIYLKKYPELEEFIGTEGEDWADLMGMNMDVPRSRGGVEGMQDLGLGQNAMEEVSGASTRGGLVGSLSDIPEAAARNTEYITGQTTFAELVDAVEKKISTINGLMDNPVYGFTTGVTGDVRYTGRELITRYEEYTNLVSDLSRLKAANKDFIEDFKIQKGIGVIDGKISDLENEVARLRSSGGSSAEIRQATTNLTNARASRDAIVLEAETAAMTRNYDEAYILRLRSEGYYKTDDPVKRRSIEAKVNADLDAVRSREPVAKIRRPDGTMVDAPRTKGRVSYGDRYTAIQDRIKELTGGGSMIKPSWFSGLEREQSKLVESLMDYVIVSEVHSRSKAMTGIFGSMGFVPSEAAFGQIIGGVANKFIPRIESRIASVYRAHGILSNMDIEIARRLGDKSTGQTASEVFKDVLNSLPTRERDILEDIIGNEISWGTDPYDLVLRLKSHLAGKNRLSPGPKIGPDGVIQLDKNGKVLKATSERTAAKAEFYEQHIRPWFEKAYPNQKYSMEAANQKLKTLAPSRAKNVKSQMTPMSTDADSAVVKAWFETLLGRSEIKGSSRSAKLGTYIGTGANREWLPTQGAGDSVLTRRLKELKSARDRMRTMTAPDLDIGAFLENPGLSQRTPTWYAHVLQTHADELDDVIAMKRAANLEIVETRKLVNTRTGRIQEAQGAIDEFRSAPGKIKELEDKIRIGTGRLERIKTTGRDLDGIVPSKSRIAKFEKDLAEAVKQLEQLNKLPRRIDDVVSAAEKKSAEIAEATLPAVKIETEINDLAVERDALISKSRTKSGLNKTEQKRLGSLRRRIEKLRGEAKKIRDAAPKGLTEREAKVFEIPARMRNVKGANKIIDDYNARMSSPLFAKAKADRGIVDAVLSLAGFDLHRYTQGFTSDGISYALMPNGDRLVIKEEEWLALFTPKMTPAEIRSNRAEISDLVSSLNEENKILAQRIVDAEKFLYKYDIDEAMLASEPIPGLASRREEFILNARRDLQNSMAAIESNNETVKQLRMRADAMLTANRQAGLEKMRILVHGASARGKRPASLPVFDSFGLSRFIDFTHPAHRGLGTFETAKGIPNGFDVVSVQNTIIKEFEAEAYQANLQKLIQLVDSNVQVFQDYSMNQRLVAAIEQVKQGGQLPDEFKRSIERQSKFDTSLKANYDRLQDEIAKRRPAIETPSGGVVKDKSRAGVLADKNVLVDTKIAEQRKATMQASWFATDEAKFMAELSDMERNLFVQMYLDMQNDVKFIEGARDEALSAVNRAKNKASELGDKVNTARIRAQDWVEQADIAKQESTGLPIGENLPATTTVDEYGVPMLKPNSKPGEEPMIPVRDKKTGKVKNFKTDKAYLSNDEIFEPAIDDVSVLRQPEDFRNLADTILSDSEKVGPYAIRAEGQVATNIVDTVTRQQDELVGRAEERLKRVLADKKSTKRQIDLARTNLSTVRAARNDAISNARGPAGALEEYMDARQGFESVSLKGPDKVDADGNKRWFTLVPAEPMRAYNSAKETAEQWAITNKKALEDAQKAWETKSKTLNMTQDVVRELLNVSSKNFSEINFRFGSFADYWEQVYNQRGLVESLRNDLIMVDNLITKMPPKKAQEIVAKTAGKNVKPAAIQQAIEQYRTWISDNKEVFEKLAQDPDSPIHKAWAAAAKADFDMILLEKSKRIEVLNLIRAETPVWETQVIQPFADEWEKIAKKSGLFKQNALGGQRFNDGQTTGFPGLLGNREALELLDNIAKIREPGVVADMAKFMRGYTGFFRAYATLSPGFHVRNGISNVFSMFSAGVSTESMFTGFKYWRLFDNEIANGGTVDSFVAKLPPHHREPAKTAAQTMLGFGGGRTHDAMNGFVRNGGKLQDNVLLNSSKKVGGKVEGSAHFIMAWDSMSKGFTADQAFNRSKRFLIDYQARTILDETMRDIVPFWMWMSRNLPLQVVNRWANPKPYLMWDKLQKNFSMSEEEAGGPTPKYLAEQGAINLGGGRFFNPELPFSRVDTQIKDLTNPRKLLGYVNPGVRAPLEFLMNSDTYTGKPFSNTYNKVDGALLPFLPLLQATGQVSYDKDGNPVIDDRAMSLLKNMIPPLGRAERLGSGGSSAVGSFLGLPFTQASEGSQEAENYRRLQVLQQMQTQQGAIGRAK
jgi:hypothetical protein